MNNKLWIGLLAIGLACSSWAGTDISFWCGKPDTGVLTVEVPEGWTMQEDQGAKDGSSDLVQSIVGLSNTNRTVLLLHCLAANYVNEGIKGLEMTLLESTILERGQIRGESADFAFSFAKRMLNGTMVRYDMQGGGKVGEVGCIFTCNLRDTNDLPVVKRVLETLKYRP